MATKLKRLRIDEISLVDKGSNPHSFVTLFKRDAPQSDDVEDLEKRKRIRVADPFEDEPGRRGRGPEDFDRLNFNSSGVGPATDALWIRFDNLRRQKGPGQGGSAFQEAWASLSDDEKNAVRAEEQSAEAARQAAAAAAEKERQREMMKQMNNSKLEDIVKLAHDVDAGRMGNHADRASWYRAITKAAAETQRKPNESPQQSFTRFVMEDADGKVMFKCYQTAAGTDYVPPAPEPTPVIKSDSAYGRLKKIAGELCAENPGLTASAAFVKVFTDPANRELAELSKRESAFA
jgi:hypothetical protein